MYKRKDLFPKKAGFSLMPDFIAGSIADIDFSYLRRKGITTCFLDLDGTVVDRGTYEITPALRRALMQSGLDIKIATNRPKSRSLKRLKEDLSASGVIHPAGIYGKPTKRYMRLALAEFGLHPHEVVMIGDRYIQDVLGANRSGIFSLVVYKLGRSVNTADRLVSALEKNRTKMLEKSYEKV
jgi:HAD superfamily phosphatase (TIGR01668 family)